jgi:hypothetical protein
MVAEHKEYVYKELSGNEPLKASIWYKRDPSGVAKPIGTSYHTVRLFIAAVQRNQANLLSTLLSRR